MGSLPPRVQTVIAKLLFGPLRRWMSSVESVPLAPQARLALIRLALKNARRSVVPLVLAGGFVAWLGWESGSRRVALLTALITAVVVAWRFALGRHAHRELDVRDIDRVEYELAGNSLLAGTLWAVATVGIYPSLDPRAAAAHVVVLIGSAAVAAHFMTLTRWSYALLLIPSLGSLALMSALNEQVRPVRVRIQTRG